MAVSANFGNMFSMAGASLFLPFLPLLPKQILLTNLLTDMPEMTIANDEVDAEWIEQPHRWDVRFIYFMAIFGLVSSLFDYLTFGVLLWALKAGAVEFRTGPDGSSSLSSLPPPLCWFYARVGCFFEAALRSLLVATLLVVMSTVILPPTHHWESSLGLFRCPYFFCSFPCRFSLDLHSHC